MLKGKKGLYVLLPLVLFIWGAILYKITDAFTPKNNDIIEKYSPSYKHKGAVNPMRQSSSRDKETKTLSGSYVVINKIKVCKNCGIKNRIDGLLEGQHAKCSICKTIL